MIQGFFFPDVIKECKDKREQDAQSKYKPGCSVLETKALKVDNAIEPDLHDQIDQIEQHHIQKRQYSSEERFLESAQYRIHVADPAGRVKYIREIDEAAPEIERRDQNIRQ